MKIASSLLWVIGLAFSVVIAQKLKIWTGGPAMLCFALAAIFALPGLWRDGLGRLNLFILVSGLAIAAWIAIRAWFSPAVELAMLDVSLVAMAVSTFIVLHNAFQSKAAEKIIICGIAVILLANLGVMAVQMRDLDYYAVVPIPNAGWPTGFFSHYSHCSAFLITSSLILGGFAIHSSWPKVARVALGALAILGLAAVYITKSRSGMIGAGAGFMTLTAFWIITAKRDDKKWSHIALIIAPLLMLALSIFALSLLGSVEETRGGENLTGMMDNTFRLYALGLAASCIALHPFLGGGSRSFSWELYQFWEVGAINAMDKDPEHVHNELVQVITDYGIIGLVLLLAFVLSILVLGSFRCFTRGAWSSQPNADAWRIGGIAAFIGLLAQSNFEGILRIVPGAVALALCLAAASHGFTKPQNAASRKRPWFHSITLTGTTLILICIMGLYGWKGSRATVDMWQVLVSKPAPGLKTQIDSYSTALETWELESFYRDRGIARFQLAFENKPENEYEVLLKLALEDYEAAAGLHPLTPLHPRNSANTHSLLGNHEETIADYERAIALQGGMETAYKIHYQYAKVLYDIGSQALRDGDHRKALKHLESAFEQISQTLPYIHGPRFYFYEANIPRYLGDALAKHGEFQKALEYYDIASSKREGTGANFFAAIMLRSQGKRALNDGRPADALRLFLETEGRFQKIGDLFTAEYRAKLLSELQTEIQALKQEGITPSEEIRFERVPSDQPRLYRGE